MTQTDELFTGQKRENQDTTLGLYNYKARFYSTTVGRFTSADSMTTDGLNRFAYVRNNPLTYNDPTGHGIIVYKDDGEEVSCPASNPDCLDSGPGPVGGSGPAAPADPCDLGCLYRQIDAYCHSSASDDDARCGKGVDSQTGCRWDDRACDQAARDPDTGCVKTDMECQNRACADPSGVRYGCPRRPDRDPCKDQPCGDPNWKCVEAAGIPAVQVISYGLGWVRFFRTGVAPDPPPYIDQTVQNAAEQCSHGIIDGP